MSNFSADVQGAGIRTISNTTAQANVKENNQELGQDDFMQLMLAQFQNQDPLSPMDNGEFMGQMAQFSTVNGITEMQSSLEGMLSSMQSNQVLEASALVGKDVLVPSSTAGFEQGEGLRGVIELPVSAQGVQLEIVDMSGAVVGRSQLGAQPAGRVQFDWDGTTINGGTAPAGQYRIQATFSNGDENEAATTMVRAEVESVSFSTSGGNSELSIKGVGTRSLTDVKEIS